MFLILTKAICQKSHPQFFLRHISLSRLNYMYFGHISFSEAYLIWYNNNHLFLNHKFAGHWSSSPHCADSHYGEAGVAVLHVSFILFLAPADYSEVIFSHDNGRSASMASKCNLEGNEREAKACRYFHSLAQLWQIISALFYFTKTSDEGAEKSLAGKLLPINSTLGKGVQSLGLHEPSLSQWRNVSLSSLI